MGYFKTYFELCNRIWQMDPIILHAHYGLSALPAMCAVRSMFWKRAKGVVTYHGSDLNLGRERWVSWAAGLLAHARIVVSAPLQTLLPLSSEVIPCGIDFESKESTLTNTRGRLGLDANAFVVLFCSSFTRPEKDPVFAHSVIDELRKRNPQRNIEFLELKGLDRAGVTAVMKASDALLMCSVSEGSPQVIKEALLNGLPIVSNDVGEVGRICIGSTGNHIISKSIGAYVDALQTVMGTGTRSTAGPNFTSYDNRTVARRLMSVYNRVCPGL